MNAVDEKCFKVLRSPRRADHCVFDFYRFCDVLVHLLMQYDLKLYSYTRRLRNLVVLTLSIQTDSRKLNSNKITKGYT